MHIEMVNLLDGDYELVPANTTTPKSVYLNYTDLNQDLGHVGTGRISLRIMGKTMKSKF